MKFHFSDCPTKKGYDCCTCDMAGEEAAIIDWQIARQEGKERWWHFTAKLTLATFGPGKIPKVRI